jgi:hypothetical protein
MSPPPAWVNIRWLGPTRLDPELEFTWTGLDDRDVPLHVVGVAVEPTLVLIIHVSPVFRRKGKA